MPNIIPLKVTRNGSQATGFAEFQAGDEIDPSVLASFAPLASPALTGTPTAPTPAEGDNSTNLATTAFVQALIAALAPLASPALTGTPTAPTAAPGTNTTQIATMAALAAAVAPLATSEALAAAVPAVTHVANAAERYALAGLLPLEMVIQDDTRAVYLVTDPGNLGNDSGYTLCGVEVPANSVAPTLGTTSAFVGVALTRSNGTWDPAPTAYLDQWESSSDLATWTPIAGATNPTYVPVSGDLGNYIRPTVAAVDATGVSAYVAGNASLAVTVTLLSALFGYWQLNGNGDDASGNGNALTVVNSVPFVSDPGGGDNQVAYFDGTGSNYFDSLFSISGPWSIRCMVWIPTPVVSSGVPSIWNVNGASSYIFNAYAGWNLSSSGFQEEFNDGPTGQNIVGGYYPTGQWVDIVASYDPDNGVTVYVNGVALGTIGAGTPLDFIEFVLGDSGATSWGYGQVQSYCKETGIWTRALTADEAAALYDDGDFLTFDSFGDTP